MTPCEAGRDEHPSPGGGPKAARDAAPRHQPGGIGMGTHAAHPPHTFEVSLWHDHTSCMPSKCYCGAAASPDVSTMPKVASVVNVPSHVWSSHSGEGMAWAPLNKDDMWEDDFQTLHTPVHHPVWREDDSHRDPADGRVGLSRGSPGPHTEYQVDIGEEEAMPETVDPTWRTTHWLQLVVQGISDDEVPWYEFIIPLTVGTEGTALSLTKCLLVVWQWSIKVQGWDVCLPTPTALHIGQFMTREEVLEGVNDPLWFVAYSCALQWVGEAMHGWRWEWPVGKMPEVGVSPLVHAFWEETGVELATSCMKLCSLRGVFIRRERGPVAHVITFVDNVAMHVPSLDAWDQFVWLLATAMPRAATEVEQYGYCHGQAIDLRPIMMATQFRVTDEVGTYLCVAWALVFEGSILAYNPTRDEVEWVPACSIINDLSWVEEKSTMALVNYVPRVSQEAACIARLGACCLVSWPYDFSLQEKEDEQEEEDESEEEEEHEEVEEQGEVGSELPSSNTELKQGETEQQAKPHRQ